MVTTQQGTKPEESGRSGGPHLWEINLARDLFYLATAVALVCLAWWLRPIVQPVLLALMLAYLINPVFVWCEHKSKWSRPWCVICIFSFAVVALLGLLVAILPIGISQVRNLLDRLPDYAVDLGISNQELMDRLRARGPEVVQGTAQNLGPLWKGLSTSMGVVSEVISGATSMAVAFALFPIYCFYFCLTWPQLIAWPLPFIPASRRQRFSEVFHLMDDAVGSYFRTRLTIAMIMGGMYAAGWGIVGVPYWLLLGIAAGLLGIIPYAAGLAWLAAMLLRFLDLDGGITTTGAALAVFLWPTLIYAMVQASDDFLLTPWLQGREMNMNFMTIILAVLIGGAVAGFLGMLLAVPAAACLGICWTEVIRPRLVQFAKGH